MDWQKDTYSWLFMPSMAASASASVANRTKPNPRLRLVSRSLITIYVSCNLCRIVSDMITQSTRYNISLKKLTASSIVPNFSNPWRRVSSVVCHARPLDKISEPIHGARQRRRPRSEKKKNNVRSTYPIKSLAILNCVRRRMTGFLAAANQHTMVN